MPYRVETASTGRALCQLTACKKNGIKISKGEMRMGVWVEIEERGGWKWRHWGCVSLKQISNMQDNLENVGNAGTYRWDMLDGLEDEDKNSLSGHPELQAKVREAIISGRIAQEDIDASQAKIAEVIQAKMNGSDAENEQAPVPAKATSKKRAKAEEDEDAEDKKPAKKKRATKAKKEEDADVDADEEVKPAKKPRAKKAKKEEDSEEEIMPAKKSRGRKIKKEGDEEMEEDQETKPVPAKIPRAKKAKKEEDVDMVKDEEVEDAPAITAPKKRAPRGKEAVKEEEPNEQNNETVETAKAKAKATAKRGRKKAVKEEPVEDTTITADAESSAIAEESTLPTEPDAHVNVKGEPSDAADVASAAPNIDDLDAHISFLKNIDFNHTLMSVERDIGPDDEIMIPGIKDFDLKAMMADQASAGELDDNGIITILQQKRDELVASLESGKEVKKGGRGKKVTLATNLNPTRVSRSRTSSKI